MRDGNLNLRGYLCAAMLLDELDWDRLGIKLSRGETVILSDGTRARSLADLPPEALAPAAAPIDPIPIIANPLTDPAKRAEAGPRGHALGSAYVALRDWGRRFGRIVWNALDAGGPRLNFAPSISVLRSCPSSLDDLLRRSPQPSRHPKRASPETCRDRLDALEASLQ